MAKFDNIAGYTPKYKPPEGSAKKNSSVGKRFARAAVAVGIVTSGVDVLDSGYHDDHSSIDLSDYGVDGNLLKEMHVPSLIHRTSAAEDNPAIYESNDFGKIIKKLKGGIDGGCGELLRYLEGGAKNIRKYTNPHISYLEKLSDHAVKIMPSVGASESNVTTMNVNSSTGLSMEKGKIYAIDININPTGPITAAQTNFNYNSTILEVQSVSEGNIFNQNGDKTLFNPGINGINGSTGYIINIWGIITTPGTNVTKEGTFATVYVRAIETGISPLNILNTIISTPASEAMFHDVKNISVKVSNSQTPAPTKTPRKR